LGSLVPIRGFGLGAWFPILVDLTGLPVLVPLGVHALLSRKWRPPAGETDFMLLWLMPGAFLGAIRWSASDDPLALVLAPLLWSATAYGLPWCIRVAKDEIGVKYAAALVGALLFVPLVTTVYWAFFAQWTALGLGLGLIAVLPMGWDLLRDLRPVWRPRAL